MLPLAQLAPLIASRPNPAALLPGITHRWSSDGWSTSGSDVIALVDSIGGANANVHGTSPPQVSNINGRDAFRFQGGSQGWIQTPIIPTESYTQMSVLWVWNGASIAATQNHWAAQNASAPPSATEVAFTLGTGATQVSVDGTNIGFASGTLTQVLLFCYDAVPAPGSRRMSWWRYDAGTAINTAGGALSANLPNVNLWSLGNRPSASDPNGSQQTIGEVQTGSVFVEAADAPALLAAVAAEWAIP